MSKNAKTIVNRLKRCPESLPIECKKPHPFIFISSQDIQFLSFVMSFHLVLSFRTFLLEYTFFCSNSLHRKNPVSFGNWLWLHQAKMSHYPPVFKKSWFSTFVTVVTFRAWNPQFQVLERSNRSKLNLFLSFLSFHCHFWHLKWQNVQILLFSPISFTSPLKNIKVTDSFPHYHQMSWNVIFLQHTG